MPNRKQSLRKPIKLFISYSHKDTKFKEELLEHLNILKQKGKIDYWVDSMIELGDDWDKAILKEVKEAKIILFLLSPSSLNSRYIREKELKVAIQSYRDRKIYLVPVLVRRTPHHGLEITKRQFLPRNGKEVTDRSWGRRDNAYSQIVTELEKQLDIWHETKVFPSEFSEKIIEGLPSKQSEKKANRNQKSKSKDMTTQSKRVFLTSNEVSSFVEDSQILINELTSDKADVNFKDLFANQLKKIKSFKNRLSDLLSSTSNKYPQLEDDVESLIKAFNLADRNHTKSFYSGRSAEEDSSKLKNIFVPPIVIALTRIRQQLQQISESQNPFSSN